ncbi:hypothetical protein OG762_30465 [Streptomyces sp. NBC_01136]|uniref:hypothetical protein n=1 Tax=Streptomyces sp. NBC_01136 TaxID=2903754 RepID=UPI003863AA92|nr:hypothetical protein OG762_30465 [Streptomyces sp. NBC_01136]
MGMLCESGAPRVYGDLVHVSLHPADGFDERRPSVRIQLSGPQGAPELDEARTSPCGGGRRAAGGGRRDVTGT